MVLTTMNHCETIDVYTSLTIINHKLNDYEPWSTVDYPSSAIVNPSFNGFTTMKPSFLSRFSWHQPGECLACTDPPSARGCHGATDAEPNGPRSHLAAGRAGRALDRQFLVLVGRSAGGTNRFTRRITRQNHDRTSCLSRTPRGWSWRFLKIS